MKDWIKKWGGWIIATITALIEALTHLPKVH